MEAIFSLGGCMRDELPRGRWLNGSQQAKMVGISKATMSRLHRRGVTPWAVYKKVGTSSIQWIADSADVQDWLASNCIKAEAMR